ncbi:MAG: hypothetical protein DI619_04890 [Francisella sp.]|jgi:lipoprotein|nr:MAG: hypothetical protein DI619_04890 [Francisella sp.]
MRYYSLCFLLFLLVSCDGNPFRKNVQTVLSEDDLIDHIAHHIQDLAPVNYGEVQIILIRARLRDLHYSFEELQKLEQMMRERVKSEQEARFYANRLYQILDQELSWSVEHTKALTSIPIQ